MLNTTPLSSTIDTTSTTCTALILLPSRQRPARTRSLPARINLPSQALASISEEHSDGHNHNHNDKQGVAELRSRIQRPGAKKSEYLESPNPEPQFKSKSTSGPFLGADSDTTTTIATGTVQPRLLLQWSKSDPSPLTRNQLGDNTSASSNPKNKAKLRIRTRTSSSSLSSRFNFDRDCGICFDPAVRPSRTKCCGKVFCEEHLHDWLHGSSNRCPAYRPPETSSGPSPDSPRSATLLLMLNAVSQSLTQKIARGLARRDTNQDFGYDSATPHTEGDYLRL
ncbi:uncharacterized protein C8R40DRAFT_1075462 [Lentinula edodes]|uniref:uncharacterized protein n=1 Tax=Lentinula edodes TaxID=5353 RepID=UPI001E8D92A3|nr:uncharacterized protein C8R40DRAFT_1075462 [Lentinula edodes]KAH7867627.1 hypothetical protein C8R40DRAFT_1075462 [Lentinula edodes]